MGNTHFEKDPANRRIIVTTTYDAPLKTVWDAYTHPAILEKWWAPHPWKAFTRTMDFHKGGHWHYYMESPDGQRSWGLSVFGEIVPQRSYEALDAFSDEHGKIDTTRPRLHWLVMFETAGGKTTVTAYITAQEQGAIERILEMGFEEGYKTGLRQLHDLLHRQLVPVG